MRKGPEVRVSSAFGRAKETCDSPFFLPLSEPLSLVPGTEHILVTVTETSVNGSWAMVQNLPVETSVGLVHQSLDFYPEPSHLC